MHQKSEAQLTSRVAPQCLVDANKVLKTLAHLQTLDMQVSRV